MSNPETTTPEQAAYERGFQAGWEARGKGTFLSAYTIFACSVCGISVDKSLGYVCTRPGCPTMVKAQ